MSIYKEISQKFIMKNARTDWASYRSRLTDKLTGLLSAGKKESVMIVGAGRCNDIDLVRLGEAAGNIILADVDEEGMKNAISKMPAEKQMKVQCKVMSLTGTGSKDTEAFCEEMLYYARKNAGSLTKEAFRDHLMSELEKLLKISEKTEEELLCLMLGKSADIVVCCGVCSQLFTGLSFFIRSLLYSLEPLVPGITSLEEEVNSKIRQTDDLLIPAINRALCRAAGKYVLWGNEYMPESPVEGAQQCIEDVRNHFTPAESHLEWEFNRAEGITYDMLMQLVEI